MTIAVVAAAYGVAALVGTLVARRLCDGGTPFVDGPRPVVVKNWIVVLAGILLGAGVASHAASTAQLATVGLVVVALAATTVCDLTLGIIPDLFTLVPLAALVLTAALHRDFGPFFSAAIVAFPFACAAALTRGRGMGWGDVKLAALGGALLGAPGATLAFVVGCVLAYLLSRLTGDRGKPIPLGPYLIGGIGAVLMIGSKS